MSKEHRSREKPLPTGYSLQHRQIQGYKNGIDPKYQRDFMTAVHLGDFQNDWDLVDPIGETVVRVSGSQRKRAIDMAWKMVE